jgi:hypothetical protein
MEKSATFIAGIAVGGLLLGAGYLAGRSSLAAPRPQDETGAEDEHAPPRPGPSARRGHHKPPKQEVPLIVGVTASSAEPPAGAVIQVGEEMAVHAAPDESSPVTGTVPIYTQVRVLEARDDGWTVVSRPGDRSATFGWVAWAPRHDTGALGTAAPSSSARPPASP